MGVRKVLRSFDKDTLVLQVLENEDYHFLVSVLPQGSNLLPGNKRPDTVGEPPDHSFY
jgi:hypothetical protein